MPSAQTRLRKLLSVPLRSQGHCGVGRVLSELHWVWFGVPLGGTRRVGGLLGVAGRLSGTVSSFRAIGKDSDAGRD